MIPALFCIFTWVGFLQHTLTYKLQSSRLAGFLR